ncbi:hypothetical protein LguiB_013534 [Lonicera macranthoides]
MWHQIDDLLFRQLALKFRDLNHLKEAFHKSGKMANAIIVYVDEVQRIVPYLSIK